MRTLAITQNITLDGSIEMIGDWFDPQEAAQDPSRGPEARRRNTRTRSSQPGEPGASR